MITKAGEAKNANEVANLEEEIKLAFAEHEIDKYTNPEATIENKIKSILEKQYGEGNITVEKSGRNYKAKVKDTKTVYRVKYDGAVEKYEEMDPTSIYARLDDDGTLYLRTTNQDNYHLYTSSDSVQSNWNSAGNASKSSVTKVTIEEPIAPNSAQYMFDGFRKLIRIEKIENLHTENVINMRGMFGGCPNLINIDIGNFDTSKVTNMKSMFDGCNKITNLNVSGFNTNNVTDMNWMFASCNKLTNLDVSGFNTNNVSNMNNMFRYCQNLINLDVSGFNTSKVSDMNCMFTGCSKLTNIDVSSFDTSKVTNMASMFDGCNNVTNLNVSSFNTNNVTSMSWMFAGCQALTSLDLNSFNTNKVSNMNNIFRGCSKLTTLKLGNNFVINEGTNIDDMFNKFTGIVITAKQDTVTKIWTKFTSFQAENFNVIN